MSDFTKLLTSGALWLIAMATQVGGFTNPAMAALLAFAGGGFFIWATVHHALERRRQGKLIMEASHLILIGLIGSAICLLFAATGYGLSLYHKPPQLDSAIASETPTALLAEPAIDWDGNGDVLLTGRATRSGNNQIIYLDWGNFGSGYTTVLSGGFIAERRAEIAKIEHFVRDQGLKIVVGRVTLADGNQQILQWGEKGYDNTKVGITYGSYAGRVIIVGKDGNEERYPFIILSTSRDQKPQKPIIIGPNVFEFFKRWTSGIY